MNIITLCAYALIICALIILLKQYKPEFALTVSIVGSAVLLLMILGEILPIFEKIRNLASESGVSTDFLEIVIKALGICYLTQFAADCCKDAGETALAGKVEIGGKITIVVLSLPLFTEVMEVITSLIE